MLHRATTPDLVLQLLESKEAIEGSLNSLVELREISRPPFLRPEIPKA